MDLTANRTTANLSAERAAELTSARAAIRAATDAWDAAGTDTAGCRAALDDLAAAQDRARAALA